jgi:xanthine dehydrogenase accessory factor
VVTLRFEALDESAMNGWATPAPRFHVELHGAGHVGQAIVALLRDIDCTVRWIDMRNVEDNWPGRPDARMLANLPSHIEWLPSDEPEAEVQDAPAAACHLVLTHRHDLDLRIIEAVLRRGDAAFAGLIGSESKRARFLRRLHEKGLSQAQLAAMVCPIGLPGIAGKEPAVIAVSVVAQLLSMRTP